MTDPTRAIQERGAPGDPDSQGDCGDDSGALPSSPDPGQGATPASVGARGAFRTAAVAFGTASAAGRQPGVDHRPRSGATDERRPRPLSPVRRLERPARPPARPPDTPEAGGSTGDPDWVGMSDGELVAAHLAGDRAAFGELAQRHRQSVWLTCLRVTENHHDAEDQTQAAMEKALRSAGSYRGQCEFGAWVRTIAENESRNAVRARQLRANKGPRDERLLVDTAAPDPQQEVTDRLWLAGVLEQLPEPYQSTFRLIYEHGLSKAEAAGVQQVEPSTVGSRCHRAKAMLAQYLAESGNY